MRILVLTYGTEGDTRPLLALSQALIRAGHDVTLLGEARSLGLASTLGVSAVPLAGDIRLLFADWSRSGPRGVAKALVALTNTHTAAWMAQTLQAARGCDAIVVSGLAGFAGLSVAQSLGIPAIGAGMIPLTPSRTFPSPFLPPAWVPALLNRASLALTNQMLWRALRQALNRARADVLGLPAQAALWTQHPMLYGISPTLLPPPPDWPANAALCGQWVAPLGEAFVPGAALRQFLDAGPAPLYLGFGSMTGIDLPRMLDQVIPALEGRRAVIWPGWSDLGGMALPDNLLCIEATPHDWLFPRMSAVIHHGGSGTTHSAARAGKPSIVMPFAGDQFFWAERLRRLGIAPRRLSFERPDPTAFARALAYVEARETRARAEVIGQAMARENGLADGVARIEALLGLAAPAARPRSA
ncbi:glycosyltransferase [Bordetella trematum]|uniref:glycosyltransferase n=1 Tax=Bordetella trematum TaxID=123899 RepID=UPI0013FDE98A|nr:glycosyltransferase [Bordetella trematum]